MPFALEKKQREKVKGSSENAGGLPDTEVSVAGVVASDRGDPACVRADVAGPGLGDVQGAVCLQAHAGNGLHVDHGAVFFPDVPGKKNMFF